jgi:hypothetical protein
MTSSMPATRTSSSIQDSSPMSALTKRLGDMPPSSSSDSSPSCEPSGSLSGSGARPRCLTFGFGGDGAGDGSGDWFQDAMGGS